MNKHANLRLSAELIAVVLPFIAKGDIRYYLNGINVRPHPDGGAVICATNGHAFGAIYDRSAACEHEVILSLDEAMKDAIKAKKGGYRSVVLRGDHLAVVDRDGEEIYLQPGLIEMEAKYPRYETVIPNVESLAPGLVGTYGSSLLARCKKAAAAAARARDLDPSRFSGMQFFSMDGLPGSRAVVRFSFEPDFVGVLMSMRDDEVSPKLPTWAGLIQSPDLPPVASEVQ
jgi:hypothetical protein